MLSGKTFDELSDDEINYICTLKWEEVEEYLTKIHGKECWEGFTKRFIERMNIIAKKYKLDFRADEELS